MKTGIMKKEECVCICVCAVCNGIYLQLNKTIMFLKENILLIVILKHKEK